MGENGGEWEWREWSLEILHITLMGECDIDLRGELCNASDCVL